MLWDLSSLWASCPQFVGSEWIPGAGPMWGVSKGVEWGLYHMLVLVVLPHRSYFFCKCVCLGTCAPLYVVDFLGTGCPGCGGEHFLFPYHEHQRGEAWPSLTGLQFGVFAGACPVWSFDQFQP
eukprot:620699-Pelagomonas_calceolata.AAC.1